MKTKMYVIKKYRPLHVNNRVIYRFEHAYDYTTDSPKKNRNAGKHYKRIVTTGYHINVDEEIFIAEGDNTFFGNDNPIYRWVPMDEDTSHKPPMWGPFYFSEEQLKRMKPIGKMNKSSNRWLVTID